MSSGFREIRCPGLKEAAFNLQSIVTDLGCIGGGQNLGKVSNPVVFFYVCTDLAR
jgi:hypothetical protein